MTASELKITFHLEWMHKVKYILIEHVLSFLCFILHWEKDYMCTSVKRPVGATSVCLSSHQSKNTFPPYHLSLPTKKQGGNKWSRKKIVGEFASSLRNTVDNEVCPLSDTHLSSVTGGCAPGCSKAATLLHAVISFISLVHSFWTPRFPLVVRCSV